MSKFKVGDKVRVIRWIARNHADVRVGRVGVIRMDDGTSLPYKVFEVDAENHDWFCGEEIELVTDVPQTDLTVLKAELEQVRREYRGLWRSRHDQELAAERLFVILERNGLLKEPEPEKTVPQLWDELRQQVTTRGWTDGAKLIDALQKKIAEG